MAVIEYWIQLENRSWDICPKGRDRLTGLKVEEFVGGKPPVTVTIKSPGTGATRSVKMFQPVRDSDGDVADALILRRYKPPQKADKSDAWTVPDDRKVNPWDLNELNPTDTGTMGTIPGPVIECSVGDSVIVHFRNMDMRKRPLFKLSSAVTARGMSAQMFAGGTMASTSAEMTKPGGMAGMAGMAGRQTRTAQSSREEFLTANPNLRDLVDFIPFPFFIPLPILQRTHSLHTHGFVFAPTSDGAYPLTPPDASQPVGAEATLWSNVAVNGGFKQGDRVPPGATFVYSWNTIGWPTTQGVWLYHDHSVCDMENVGLGAIGIVVIHPPVGDPVLEQDVDIRLAGGELDPAFLPGGSANGSPIDFHCFPFPLEARIGVLPHQLENLGQSAAGGDMGTMSMMAAAMAEGAAEEAKGEKGGRKAKAAPEPKSKHAPAEHLLHVGEMAFRLDQKLSVITGFCFSRYRTPPSKALYLQLYHEFANIGMCVNGRKYLGNTPTMLSGPTTKMKFGVVGMGSMAHTFHIHGHRWLIPGPSNKGSNGLQFGGPVDAPVSQFEDTRLFGPANSFSFTINEGNGFMRASPAIGEWHMHCHVLAHMMDGMMGSLLIVNGGESALFGLPSGKPCPTMPLNTPPPPPPPNVTNVDVVDFKYNPDPISIKAGDAVHWIWKALDHSTTSDTGIWDSGVHNTGFTFDHTFNSVGTFGYHCSQHGSPGAGMHGTVTVTP